VKKTLFPQMMWNLILGAGFLLLLSACAVWSFSFSTPTPTFEPWCSRPYCQTLTAVPSLPTLTRSPTSTPEPVFTPQATPTLQPTPPPPVPAFEHILWIVLENKDFTQVIGNENMPHFNRLAAENTLLTNYYAVAHPSLPNYLALIGGDTFGVNRNCEDCFLDAPSLPDLIEASGRQWKTYQESMPGPCFLGSRGEYAQKHNPFVYFDAIRFNAQRCSSHVVPLDQLTEDLARQNLPDFAFITPNLCHSGHDCPLAEMDAWLGQLIDGLFQSGGLGEHYLIVITFDEASGDDSSGCCGLPPKAGGRIATLFISPQARPHFEDSIPYSHYSLLKTVSIAWGLPFLGHAADPETEAILAPWLTTRADAPLFIGAGDITVCGHPGDDITARLLDQFPEADVFTTGDNSNEEGAPEQYQKCFAPAWGRHLERIHPSPGNHDYQTENGAAYHAFFGPAVGEPGKGYYSYDLAGWHIIALNGNCAAVGGCGPDSPQAQWLRADLAAHPARCTLAYWHQPRFSSGLHGNSEATLEFWRALYEARAEIILNGHDHLYERFAPQDPAGNLDELNGIRQFTVGTGGAFYRPAGPLPAPNSERLILNTFGVLQLTLMEDGYRWRFLPEPGRPQTDQGEAQCH